MLGKILKHDMRTTLRMFLPLFLGFFFVTIMTKITFHISSSKVVFIGGDLLNIVSAIFIFLYVIGCVAIFLVTVIFNTTYFYNTMTRDQAYLTHTIPVKTSTIITGKVICSVIWQVLAVLCFILSLFIFYTGTISMEELWRLFSEIQSELVRNFGSSVTLFYFQFIFLSVLSLFFAPLVIYASIAVGHLFKKHRVIGSIVVYFGFNIVIQTVMNKATSIVFNVYSSQMIDSRTMLSLVPSFIEGSLFVMILVTLVFTLLSFFLTNYIFKNKLNLE